MNFTSFPELTTKRLILRRPEVNDTDDLFLLRTDASVNEFIERPLPLTKEDIEYFIKKIWKGIENDGWLYWAITIKGDNKLIGTICYWNIKEEKGEAEIGFELLPAYQGRGIMHETIQQVISFGFNTMQLKTIIAYTSSANMKSRLLLEKNKFRFYKNTKTDEKNKTEYAIYKLRRRKA